MSVTAVLPESYMPEPMQRLAYYQRMAQADSDAAIFDIFEELREMYGPAPEEVLAWVEIMVLRRRLKALGASGLSASLDPVAIRLGLTFVPEAAVDRADLAQRCQNDPGRYRLLPSGRLAITTEPTASDAPVPFLRAVREALGGLQLTGGARVDG